MFNTGKNRTKGFTLIEVLLVIVIIGMLAGVAIMVVPGIREGAKKDTTKALIHQLEGAMETYNLHVGHYPTEEEGGIRALLVRPTFQDEKLGEKWQGPYIKQEPKDGWGNPLNYEVVDTTGMAGAERPATPFTLSSNGPDGQQGTDDDITNKPAESDSMAI